MAAAKLMNVGPKSAAWLRQVGVRTLEDLQNLGSVAAFMKVKRAGFRPSLNLLYALEGALLGCHWQQVPDARRSELLAAVEVAEAALPPPRGRAAAMPVTTTLGEGAEGDGGAGGDAPSFGFDDPAAEPAGDD